jgi:hypothetical protein
VLTPIAAAALANGVVTFTVGVAGVSEDGFALLDPIAAARGSNRTPDVAGSESCNRSTTGAAGLLGALDAIRDRITAAETVPETITSTESVTLPCEWTLPETPPGEVLDPALVNVSIIDTTTIPTLYVPSAGDCALAPGPGWYYDDPVAPTKIVVCPVTCDRLSTLPRASVEVLLGCQRNEILR